MRAEQIIGKILPPRTLEDFEVTNFFEVGSPKEFGETYHIEFQRKDIYLLDLKGKECDRKDTW